MIKLASWNVNSLKVRLEQVLSWFDSEKVGVLALQETKLTDEQFPEQIFIERGLYVAYSGQKTYNGVAIISRFPITNVVKDIPDFDDPQRRVLLANTAGMRLINLYVPNGADLVSDKYQYKLAWLHRVNAWIAQQLQEHEAVAVVGDFNIAPHDLDVHDPKSWEGNILVSPSEREAFARLLQQGLTDSFRHCHPNEQAFSWWDYRQAGFQRNRGLRIDHILLSQALINRCKAAGIDIKPRGAERPSDHAPVWVEV